MCKHNVRRNYRIGRRCRAFSTFSTGYTVPYLLYRSILPNHAALPIFPLFVYVIPAQCFPLGTSQWSETLAVFSKPVQVNQKDTGALDMNMPLTQDPARRKWERDKNRERQKWFQVRHRLLLRGTIPQFPSLPPSCLIASSWHVTQSRRDTRGFYPFSFISKLSINFSTLRLFSLVESNKAKKVKK